MEMKGKFLWNIKTKWISTISPIKHVLSKYYTLIMKMALDALTIPSTKSDLFLLIDVETLLGLNAMTLTLKVIHLLIKFAQWRDVFVYDFIVGVKICERDVYHMFYDMWSFFESNVFNNFIALINIAHENINLHWITNLNIIIDHWLLNLLGNTCEQHLHIKLGHQFLLQGRYMAILLHLWNNNVKKLPFNLLLNYKVSSLLKILWMHWILFTHNVGYTKTWKKVQCSFGNHQGRPLLT